MNKIPFIDMQRVHQAHKTRIEEAALRVIRSGQYLRGAETQALEQKLEHLYNVSNVVACSNGLDALRLILASYIKLGKLRAGDTVIVPANTYIATILPITEFGLRPLLIEPEPDTMNLDFVKADKEIEVRANTTESVKAVMIVHLYGMPCWDAEICNKWADNGILIIEDNAQAIGAQAACIGFNGGNYTGGLAHASATSFYPTKNIGAIGDAGAVATCCEELAQTVRALANYGSDIRYHNIYQGYNCRMDELQAAMLCEMLDDIQIVIDNRREIADIYTSNITNPSVTLPYTSLSESSCHSGAVWHQYVIRTGHRDALRQYLFEAGIGTDIHYATPPHKQPCYQGVLSGSYPVTESISKSVLSIPIASCTPGEAKYISEVVNRWQP